MTLPNRQKGFTLLEILVALGILALALTALVKGVAQNSANASYLRDKSLSHWVASNTITEWQVTRKWPATGKHQGNELMAGQEWHWRIEVKATPDSNIRRLEVTVSDLEDAPPLSQLTAFVTKP